jgi:hypothetical protein
MLSIAVVVGSKILQSFFEELKCYVYFQHGSALIQTTENPV